MMRLSKIAIVLDETSAPFTPEDFINKLFPNFWSWLINFLALIVLFVAVYFLAYKPIRKYVNARKEYVERNIRDSEAAKEINERKAKESEKIIVEAKVEANDIIQKAKADASKQAGIIVDEAKAEAARRQVDADIAIKQAEERSKIAIQEQIINVAMDASKKVLGRAVDEEDNHRLVKEFVQDVSEGKDDA